VQGVALVALQSTITLAISRWMNPCSKRPGKKVFVPRFSLESWAQHMADPKQYASILREHARSIREQLKLLDKRYVLSVLPEADLIRAVGTAKPKAPVFLRCFSGSGLDGADEEIRTLRITDSTLNPSIKPESVEH
jgi:hypothetical protein